MSENKKPRLAEVLGVEVGEKLLIDGRNRNPYSVTDEGLIVDCDGGVCYEVVTYLFNHPNRLIREPRWTEQEVKDAKAIQRILPEARDIDRVTETMTVVRDEDGFCLLTLQKDMFPNVKEGPAAKLADIIGGTD